MDMYAVIPTYNRPDELLKLVTQLNDQGVEEILVINNGRGLPPGIVDTCHIFYDTNCDPHIYQMWNYGLRFWDLSRGHCVAILNDDIELPDNFVHRMTDVMQSFKPTIAFPNQHGHQVSLFNVAPGPTDLSHRISGYAFVVNGNHDISCDQRFKWWYGDDDLDWRARSDYSGTYLVQDVTVKHLYPSESTNNSPERTAQAGRDRKLFIAKHGRAPW